VLTMNSVKILHAVRSAITAIAELLVRTGGMAWDWRRFVTYLRNDPRIFVQLFSWWRNVWVSDSGRGAGSTGTTQPSILQG